MNKKGFFTAISFVAVVSTFAYFPKISTAKTAKVDAMKLYSNHCNACHDKNGKPTDLGKELESTDFTEGKWQASVTDEKIIKQITDGSPEKMMPFKETLNQDEIKALVPVIRSFAKK